jgi:hypothetical protein
MALTRVVIVGGGGAGNAAAFALRKKGFDGEVVIISADHNRPYDRPYLSKEFLRGEVELPKVFLKWEDEHTSAILGSFRAGFGQRSLELRVAARLHSMCSSSAWAAPDGCPAPLTRRTS